MSETTSTENILSAKPRAGSGMTIKVLKGSFWVLMGQMLPLIATFIASPFVIRSLGSESYGVLILVGLISGYFSFADFGMVLASTKFGSEAYGNGSRDGEGMAVRTASLIAILSSLTIALPMFIFSEWIVGELLKVPLYLQKQAGVALKLTSVAFVLSFQGNIFNTPQLARMRMDLNVFINSGAKILMTLSTPVVLYFGGGIVQATVVAFIAAIVIMVGNIIISGKLLPELYKTTINRALVRPLLRFGGNVVLYAIGLTIINNLEKILLTRLVSVKHLAYYSVAFTFANMTTMFSMAMVQTLIPAFSQLLSPDKRSELNSLFSRCVRVCLLGLLPSVAFLLVIARPFFTIWAGKEFGVESVYPFYILLAGIFFSIMVYVPNCILLASGRSDIFARFYLFEIIPYAALTYFLISKFGILGAAMAWSLREIFNAIVFINFSKKHVGVVFNIRHQLKDLSLGFLILFLPAPFALFYNNFSIWLVLLVPVCMTGYLILVWKRLIDEKEKVWIRNKLNSFVPAIFK